MPLATLRHSLGFVALAVAVFAFVRKQQVGDWYAEPLRVPYSGETFSKVPLQIEKNGFYLVQLEISRKAEGESIKPPIASPLDSLVVYNGKEIGSANSSEWYGQGEVFFGFYGFPAIKGQSVQLSIKPSRTLSTYRSHVLHLTVQRDNWDYGLFLWQEVGWFLLIVLFLLIAACLFYKDVKTIYRTLGSRRKLRLQAVSTSRPE